MTTPTDGIPYYFSRHQGGFEPSGLAKNPWFDNAIAGGPIASLIGTIIDEAQLDTAFEICRLSIDILGIVPRTLLVPRVTPVRTGRQAQLHRIELLVDGKIVTQAHVLRTRHLETPATLPPCHYPPPESVAAAKALIGASMAGAIETRPIKGHVLEPGRGTLWLSMNGEVVEGTPPSPFVKACLFADYGNGVGSATRPDEWSFANLDIDIHFLRMPEGEWFLLDAHTQGCGNGHALAQSIFADAHGVYAKGTQTIFVAPAMAGSQFK
jgi:acyl-CoA thioesterase